MTPVDIVQIVIAIIMLLGVVAAYLTALLNWRSSPVLLATKEKHSKDLMEVLSKWRENLFTWGVPGNNPLEEVERSLPVERLILFDDLKNHVPSELDLFTIWHTFKQAREELQTRMIQLHKSISNHLTQHSRLEVLSREEESKVQPIGITHHCVDWFYTNTLSQAEGKRIPTKLNLTIPGSDPNELRGPSQNIWAWTSPIIQTTWLKDLVEEMLENIHSGQLGTAENELLLEANKIVNARNELRNLQDEILNRIAEIEAIPILTGDCKHIGRAREKLLPSRILDKIKLNNVKWYIESKRSHNNHIREHRRDPIGGIRRDFFLSQALVYFLGSSVLIQTKGQTSNVNLLGREILWPKFPDLFTDIVSILLLVFAALLIYIAFSHRPAWLRQNAIELTAGLAVLPLIFFSYNWILACVELVKSQVSVWYFYAFYFGGLVITILILTSPFIALKERHPRR